jgi:hypothetical protein
MRHRLRTLLIVLTVLPPLLACAWWGWEELKARRDAAREREAVFTFYLGITR